MFKGRPALIIIIIIITESLRVCPVSEFGAVTQRPSSERFSRERACINREAVRASAAGVWRNHGTGQQTALSDRRQPAAKAGRCPLARVVIAAAPGPGQQPRIAFLFLFFPPLPPPPPPPPPPPRLSSSSSSSSRARTHANTFTATASGSRSRATV